MIQRTQNPVKNDETVETGWQSLYRVAGMGVWISVVFILLDIALSFGGGDIPVGGMDAVGWFAHFQENEFLGLRNLGLFNVFNTILTIPLYLALYRLHRKGCPGFAALALILFLLGAAIYAANNQALSMLALSQKYAAATTEAQKGLLVSAGTVLLAQAEDFTPGSFTGLFLSSLASLAMLTVMLRGRVFSRWIAWVGLAGSSALLFFTVSVTFLPAVFDLAMVLALVGGLLMLAWDILIALGMFRLARFTPPQPERPNLAARLSPPAGEI